MTDTNRRIFQFLMATILIVALSMPLFNAPGVEAYETEDLRIINLHPNHDGGGQHFMNTVQENPGDESGTNITWSYGWLEDGDIVDDDLKEGLYIKGTAHEGKIVRVKSLRIHYPSLTGQTQVTMELIDDSKVIADVTETLDGTWLGGESKDDWDLEFREGANSHVFDKGDTLSLRMRSTESVDVDYQSGNARLELYAHQITLVEDIHVEDVNGKDMKGEYFIPKLPDELAIAHIWGIVGDALSYRDVESASITIKDPDGENVVENDSMILTPINDTWVRFDYNWSYSDDMVNENDAGTYDFTVYVHDQNAHDYPYSDSLKMNKYGAYIIEEEGEDLSKSGSAGENVLYRFQVYNAGLIADNINITHDELSGGWEATFDKDSVSPDPGEYDTVTMNVTIPLSAEIKSEKLIVVTVTSESSENDPEYPIAKRSISTTTEVTPVASISVFYTKEDKDGSTYEDTQHKSGNAEKGTDSDFILHVRNDSPYEDTIKLRIKKNSKPLDWKADIIDPDTNESRDNVTLEGKKKVSLYVRVNPATDPNAADVAYLEITGISTTNESVEKTAYLDVTRTFGVFISEVDENKQLNLNPGAPNTIEFEVENTGDEDRKFDLTLDDSQVAPDGWSVSFKNNENSVEVAAGKNAIASVEVTPRDNAERKAENYKITIIAKAHDNSEVKYEHEAELNVKEVYDVEIVIDHREKEIDKAGDSVEYLVRVKNKGNSEVTINLELGKSKKDWTAEFKEDRAASFAPGAEKEFHLTVTAPDPVDNKEKCTVTVTAKVLGHDDTAKSVTTKTKVDKGTSTAVMDVLEEYSWILALGLVVIVVAVVVYFRSRQYEEEEEEYEEEEEGYEEEEEEE